MLVMESPTIQLMCGHHTFLPPTTLTSFPSGFTMNILPTTACSLSEVLASIITLSIVLSSSHRLKHLLLVSIGMISTEKYIQIALDFSRKKVDWEKLLSMGKLRPIREVSLQLNILHGPNTYKAATSS